MAKVTTDRIGAEQIPIDIFVDSSGQFYADFNEEIMWRPKRR